jgi:O-antigen ligase
VLAAEGRLRQSAPRASLGVVAATMVAAGIVGVAVPMVGQPWLVLLFLGALAVIALVTWRLELGLWAFILATALNRYNFDVAGWQIKIEHMVLILVLLAWGLRLLLGQERLDRWPFMMLIGVYLGLALVASVVNSPDLYKSVRILTRMTLAVLGYLLIVNQVRDRAHLWRLVTVFLSVAAGAALYGIIAVCAWRMAAINIGVQYNNISGVWAPYGTLWEANLFGSYTMSACVASLVLLLSGQRTMNRPFLSAVFAVTALAMALSSARAAWVGFGVGFFFILMFMGRLRLRNLALVFAGSMVAVFLLSGLSAGGVFDEVWARVGTLQTVSQDTNVVSRLSNSQLALGEWQQSRWLGWGVDAWHINHPEIISSLPSPQLNALYDTGLLGVALFVPLILFFVGRAFAATLAAADQGENALLLALLFSFLGLLVAYQATDAFWLGFTWVHLSLLMSAVLIVESKGGQRELLRHLGRTLSGTDRERIS